jgi:hypothetical protein
MAHLEYSSGCRKPAMGNWGKPAPGDTGIATILPVGMSRQTGASKRLCSETCLPPHCAVRRGFNGLRSCITRETYIEDRFGQEILTLLYGGVRASERGSCGGALGRTKEEAQ